MISQKAKDILNNKDLIAARDRMMKKLTDFVYRPNDKKAYSEVPVLYGNGAKHVYLYDEEYNLTDPEKWVEDSLEIIADKTAHLITDDDIMRPVYLQYYAYGVHYTDFLLGAEIFFKDGRAYNKPLKTEVGTLEYPDIERNPLWIHTKKAVSAFLRAGAPLVYFGMPVVASPLNVAVNLYGQEFLIAMFEEPEAAEHDLEIITRVICEVHEYFRNNIPPEQLQCIFGSSRTMPTDCGQICGCTNSLISGELYEEFIAPYDERVLSVYKNPGMIHLCGSHTQHIKAFANMKHLRAIQLNDRAAGDLEAYFNGLRDDQIIYLEPCKEMSIERAMKITEGRRIIIVTPKR